MSRLIFEAAVLVAACFITCVWSDSLLYIGEKITEQPASLELEEEAEQEPKEEVAKKEEPTEAQADQQSPPAPQPPAAAPAPPQAAPVVAIPPPAVTPAEQGPAAPPAILPPLQLGGEAGSLASFEGDAVGGEAAGEGNSLNGSQGPRLLVQYLNEPDWQVLAGHQQLQPLLMRPAREGYEVATINRDGPQSAMSLQDFLRQAPQYRGKQFLTLPTAWRQRYADWTFSHPGNWVLFVAIDDVVFQGWVREVQFYAGLSQIDMQDVETIRIQLEFPDRATRPPEMKLIDLIPVSATSTQQDAAQ